MKIRIALIIVLLLSMFLAGCNTGTKATTPTINPASGYPAPTTEQVQTAYPAGTISQSPGKSAIATTQDPSLGAVKGTLLLKGEPVVNVAVYLGGLITDDQGRELVAGYDRTSLIRAYTDNNGNFTIYNVPEGRYGVILDLVTQAYLLDTPDGTQSILLTVKNGEATDLGKLEYQELPGL